jgi:hypothetical protein
VAAAAHLSDGLVLDGELIVWAEDKISFEALQRRAVSGGRTAARLAQEMPAHFIAFDLLQLDGQELLHVPYGERRARLEHPFTDRGLSAPWTLCPKTTEVATAQEWLASWTQVPGVEGLVIRGSGQRYLPGARALYKVRRRDTTEAVIGAITGMPPTTCDAGRLTGTVSGSGVDHEGRAELEVLPGVEPGPRFTGASPSGTLRRPIRPARRPLSCRDLGSNYPTGTDSRLNAQQAVTS